MNLNHSIKSTNGREPAEGIEEIWVDHPEVVEKGWGREIWMANNDKYCGKILEFNAGAEFSMHYHIQKHETFYILEGEIEMYGYDLSNGDMHSRTLKEGSIIVIPAGNPHKIKAITKTKVVEVSTTHYESDSYRVLPGDSQRAK